MIQKARAAWQILNNMGLRYVAFRLLFEFRRRSGLLKAKFPINPTHKSWFSLEQWKAQKTVFFFSSDSELNIPKKPLPELKTAFEKIKAGTLTFFNATDYQLGINYDWITNPDSGFRFDLNKHWTEIQDLSQAQGDIKYVWEKSRFSYLYTIIRYDYHFNVDCSAMVFDQMNDWMDKNPINLGPNYKCSQEISLRVLNWTFALNYYKNSPQLTPELFDRIQHYIYWQMRHVEDNIDFSRIAVRNNHAITETLALYLCGMLYPHYPEAAKWKKQGRKWFIEEISYQVYADGTFLQFSMNYQRVVVQLLSWAIRLSELNNNQLPEVVYERSKNCLSFLQDCMNKENGNLPNYGANDGALFFKFSDQPYRDYRPQLEALALVLGKQKQSFYEDGAWLFNAPAYNESCELAPNEGICSYPIGGFYILNEGSVKTFIRCGKHNDRPSQADNLHLDIWVNGQNVFQDAGSYKYNTEEKYIKYFGGTRSHNTVMLNGYDQMLKGSRFIWFNWTQAIEAAWKSENQYTEFSGAISAFRHLNESIIHKRVVRKYHDELRWEVVDTIIHKPQNILMHQLWHTNFPKMVTIKGNAMGTPLPVEQQKGYSSPLYGMKEGVEEFILTTNQDQIATTLLIK